MNKNKMIRRFFVSAYVRLMLPMMLFIAICVIMIWMVAVTGLQNQSLQNQRIRFESQCASINAVSDELERLNLMLSTNPAISRRLKNIMKQLEQGISAQDYDVFLTISEFLNNAFLTNPYAEAVCIYFDAGGNCYLNGEGQIEYVEDMSELPWYKSHKNFDDKRSVWTQLYYDGEEEMITLCRRIYSGGTDKMLGVMALNISRERLSSLCRTLENDESSLLYVMDAQGELLFGNGCFEQRMNNGETFIPLQLFEMEEEGILNFNGKTWSVCVSSPAESEWYIVSAIPLSTLYAIPNLLSTLLMTLLAAAGGMGCVIALSCARRDASAIADVVDAIERAKTGEFMPIMPNTEDAYRYILKNAINGFLEKDYLAIQLAERRHYEKELEYTALLAQMNPHFLFNTLETIKWRSIALTGGENDASTMIENLADILRYALETDENEVLLSREIAITQCYLSIQQIRYRNKFSFEIDADESLMDRKVMKLLFQPLVENSIYHGIRTKAGTSVICLCVYEQNGVLICKVEDNGMGIEPEQLEEIRKRLQDDGLQTKHIGLYNIGKRLRLLYGEQGRLEVESRKGGGTTVSIRLPICK